VHTSGLDADRLPFPVENALYRIVQEALTNIAKHAAANVVSIALECQPSRIQVIVTDDGCGLDTEMTLRTTTISNRLGLYGMYERATLLGGSISVGSKPGKGPPSPCKSHLARLYPFTRHSTGSRSSASVTSRGFPPSRLSQVICKNG
jgi:signal transduction histidine kinase